jgi:hypothetical protein
MIAMATPTSVLVLVIIAVLHLSLVDCVNPRKRGYHDRFRKSTAWVCSFVTALIGPLPYLVDASNDQPTKTCRIIRSAHPFGVALNAQVVGTSLVEVRRKAYLDNRKLDISLVLFSDRRRTATIVPKLFPNHNPEAT